MLAADGVGKRKHPVSNGCYATPFAVYIAYVILSSNLTKTIAVAQTGI